MKQGEEYLQQKQWEQAKQAFLRVVDIKQDYAPAYRGIGLSARGQAFEQLGKPEHKFDRHLLEEAIEELSRAFRLGDYTPETVWALHWSLRNVSNIDGIIEILKRYAENAPNLEQEFLARHYIVDEYSLIREHEEAVRWHKDLLEKMQNKVSPEKLLSSLSDATMLRSWKECGLLSEWTLLSNGLYSKLEDTYDTCVYRANYLRALMEAVYVPAGRFEEALETCDKLKAIVEKYAEQWVEARWFLADIRGGLLSIYHSTECKDLEEQIVIDGKQYLLDYENWITESSISSIKSEEVYKDPLSGKEEVSSLFDLHWQYYIFSIHDFACMCMWTGHYKDAVELFEKALAIGDNAETHFFLAGSILKATGDVEKSLDHFRQAIENPFFSRRHELKLAFLEEATFKDVWDNERFISLIEIEEQKEVQQVKNQ
ncbi:MAG: hypothetical protein NTY22_04700 [Proteobacteria bacterium]|nr:hypothetical protein [Pseudomonadota bacterium]